MSRKPPTAKRPGRAPASDEIVALAVEMVRDHGWSQAAAARELGVGESTVRGWLRAASVTPRTDVTPEIRARVEARAAAVASLEEAPPEAPPDEPLSDPSDVAGSLRDMMQRARTIAAQAAARGNHAAAQRALRDASAMATTLARVERVQAEHGDAIVVPRDRIRQSLEDYRAKVRVALERPLLCAHCHRELMSQWGEAGLSEAEAPAGEPERKR